MPRTKSAPRKGFGRRFFKKRSTALSNAKNLIDLVSLSGDTRTPKSDIYDGYPRFSDAVPVKVPRNINDQIVYSRIVVDSANTLSATLETKIAFQFSLSLHPEASSFEAIFDQYCIVAVKAVFRTVESVSTIANGIAMPRIYSVIDHDDANAITVAQAKEYNSCVEQRTVESVTRLLYPRVAIATYSGAFTGFGNGRMWIDCASDTVQHYGLKMAAEADARAGGPTELLTQLQIYYAFRNRH